MKMTGLSEGTIIEMTVTKPGAEPKTVNLSLTQEDLEVLIEMKNVSGQQS